MRYLIIEKYKELLERQNNYWRGWGNKQHNIKPIPEFDNMSDKELLDSFCFLLGQASQPMG